MIARSVRGEENGGWLEKPKKRDTASAEVEESKLAG